MGFTLETSCIHLGVMCTQGAYEYLTMLDVQEGTHILIAALSVYLEINLYRIQTVAHHSSVSASMALALVGSIP